MSARTRKLKRKVQLPRMEQLRRMVKGRRLTMKTASFQETERKLLNEITNPLETESVEQTIKNIIERKKKEKKRLSDIPDILFISAEIKFLRNLLRGSEWLDMLETRKENKTRSRIKVHMKTLQFQQWVEEEVLGFINKHVPEYIGFFDIDRLRKMVSNEAKYLIIENLTADDRIEFEARLRFLDDLTKTQDNFIKFLKKHNLIQ